MTQAEWSEALYARVRPQLTAEARSEFDLLVEQRELLLLCIALLMMAAEGKLDLTPDELRAGQAYAAEGKLLKSSQYLAERLQAALSAA
jgi:hypothetical protein